MMGSLDTIQDFLCEFGMKTNSHLVEIVIFSLLVMSPTDLRKLMREPPKIGHIYRKKSILKIKVFKKVGLVFTEKNLERFH